MASCRAIPIPDIKLASEVFIDHTKYFISTEGNKKRYECKTERTGKAVQFQSFESEVSLGR